MKNGRHMKPKSKTIRASQETADRYEQLQLASVRTETKIIPFPGVSISHEVTYQNALDDYLREIGYIE